MYAVERPSQCLAVNDNLQRDNNWPATGGPLRVTNNISKEYGLSRGSLQQQFLVLLPAAYDVT